MPSAALDGIRVIDFGQYLAGPMAAMFLADYGADVIRVDPPEGPRWENPANAILQRGKRSIALDLKQSPDLEIARQLVATADVVIEAFRPGVMARLGLSYESSAAVNPDIIWCSLPGFGHDDPRAQIPAWEGIVSAAASLYHPSVIAVEGDPMFAFSALPLASTYAAFVATHRIAAALIARHRYGRGEQIEVPLYDSAFQAIGFVAEIPASRMPNFSIMERSRAANVAGLHVDEGGQYVEFDAPARGSQAFLDRFAEDVELLKANGDTLARVRERLTKVWPQRTAADWERFGQEELNAAIGLVQSAKDWLEDEHAIASKCAIAVEDPELGSTRQAGFPVLLSGTQPEVRSGRHPLDSDRDDILRELTELTEQHPPADAPAPKPASTKHLALEGVKVLDASILLAGPTTTRILAQYGADVIKIEKAGLATGEVNPLSDDRICLIGHRTVNAGKRMMFLDLKHSDGQRVVRRLIESADVVHHNFGPATAARLGLSLPDVREQNDSAIYSTTRLHSSGGFRAEYRGHDTLGQHIAGVSARLGGDGPPRIAGFAINDNGSGHLSALGILIALFHRYRTGESQEVNAALSRTSTMLQLPFLLTYQGKRWDEPKGRNALGWGPFNRLYHASDGWFYLAACDSSPQERVAAVKGLEALASVGRADVEAWLEGCFATGPLSKWVPALQAVGIGAHQYLTLPDNLTADIPWSRRLLAAVDHPGLGKAIGIGISVLGNVGDDKLLAARRPGMDTIEILTEYGFSADIPELIKKQVIAVGENPVVRTTATEGSWRSWQDVAPTYLDKALPAIFDQLAAKVEA